MVAYRSIVDKKCFIYNDKEKIEIPKWLYGYIGRLEKDNQELRKDIKMWKHRVEKLPAYFANSTKLK